jgi:hypothetical protein
MKSHKSGMILVIWSLTLLKAWSIVSAISSARTNSNSRRKPHGQTEILVAVAGSPISGAGSEGPGIEKDFENLDEKFVGD